MAKGRMVWLSMDRGMHRYYELYLTKPKFLNGRFWGDILKTFCSKDFERITGYKLKPGECKRVRITVEEV